MTQPGHDRDSASSPPLRRVVPAERALWQEVDGRVVFLDLEGDRYFALDPVGSRIWKTLLQHPVVAEAEEQLLAIFDVEPGTLHSDIARLLEELSAAHLIEMTP